MCAYNHCIFNRVHAHCGSEAVHLGRCIVLQKATVVGEETLLHAICNGGFVFGIFQVQLFHHS